MNPQQHTTQPPPSQRERERERERDRQRETERDEKRECAQCREEENDHLESSRFRESRQ
jgi:hypothetical protein